MYAPLLCLLGYAGVTALYRLNNVRSDVDSVPHLCSKVADEISAYDKIVGNIADIFTRGKLKNYAWNELAKFTDDFGSRISGSDNLERSVDYMLSKLRKEGLENVHGENATVPRWVRGVEWAKMLKPRYANLSILGLGGSVGTSNEGILADVVVVSSFKELNNLSSEEVKGKIVIFNEKYVSYGITVEYRSRGAVEAAKLGAAAVLIRSIAPFSIGSPHTGSQSYAKDVPEIPTAAISLENAQMLHRLYQRGKTIKIHLYMGAKNYPAVTSRNTIAEIPGVSSPEKVVIVSGHLDSWDVGQGAMDDGGGAFISWISLLAMNHLALRPKRTIRCILWTGEEQGYWGARAYAKNHAYESENIKFIMESDEGTFTPMGLVFYGSSEGACILREIMRLTKKYLNAGELEISEEPVGSDITVWQSRREIPAASLKNKNGRYFWFHHSQGDSMAVENATALDLCAAFWTAVSYIIADMSVEIPA